MRWKSSLILIAFIVITISTNFALAKCPSADLTGDCFVDYEDFALMAAQWLTTDPCVPDDMVYIPDGEFEMGDHHDGLHYSPTHLVYVDSFFMSKFEITNRQYCDYLNSAEDSGEIKVDGGIVYAYSDDSNSFPYCDTNSFIICSQIDYNDVSGTFSARTKSGRDMSDDPMIQVSWYGAVAYCNWRSSEGGYDSCYNLSTWECDFPKHGYRLPTEAEWEYAARGGEHSPYYRFPWGDTINHDYANHYSNSDEYYDTNPYTTNTYHPDWDDGIVPYTSPVGIFSPNSYGLYDMTGNVWDWCNDWFYSNYYDVSPYDNPLGPSTGISRILRGGCWGCFGGLCRVAVRHRINPAIRYTNYGFRVVLPN